MPTLELVVGYQSEGASAIPRGEDRLDRWLAEQLPDHSRSAIQRWIKEGAVLVNNQPARANYRVNVEDRVTVVLPEAVPADRVEAEAIPLSILYEDADVVVIDKPSGLVVHPAPGHAEGTVVNAVLHHVPDLQGIGGEIRPGIVHRLDKDTSGLMVIAKHDAALRYLQAQFKSHKVQKHYLALVEGKVKQDQGRIIAPVGRDPRNRKRMAVITGESRSELRARPATTEYHVLARYTVPLQNEHGHGTFSLIDAHPITGRTHQIRVHFAWQGHPLVGDPIYGLKRPRLACPRLFLHAARLAFALPSSDKWREFSAPLPPDLQEVLARLETASPSR